MDEELEKIITEFNETLKAYEKKKDLFVEVWKTSMSSEDGMRIEVKKRFK